MTDVSTADLVGSPPGALPEELGGEAALVGHRESEDDTLPDQAIPGNVQHHADVGDDEPKPHRTRRK